MRRAIPGRLGKALHEHRKGALLSDEIEKAHRRIWDLFLRMLDIKGEAFDLESPSLPWRPFLTTVPFRTGSWIGTYNMAPEVGFEPTTNRLTADRSTAELLRITEGGGRLAKAQTANLSRERRT